MVYSSRLLFLCLYVQFMGDFVNAIRDYQAAVKTDPSYALAYYNAANIYFRQRQFQQVSFIVVNIHFLLLGALHMEEEDPRRRINFTLGLHAEILVRVVPKCRMFEKELRMAGDKNKHTIWALLLSLLALTTSFQQNYHNNQLVVTPNDMVGLYCRD